MTSWKDKQQSVWDLFRSQIDHKSILNIASVMSINHKDTIDMDNGNKWINKKNLDFINTLKTKVVKDPTTSLFLYL